jgi:hypothetical protein
VHRYINTFSLLYRPNAHRQIQVNINRCFDRFWHKFAFCREHIRPGLKPTASDKLLLSHITNIHCGLRYELQTETYSATVQKLPLPATAPIVIFTVQETLQRILTTKLNKLYFTHSGVVEDPVLLGCYAVWLVPKYIRAA